MNETRLGRISAASFGRGGRDDAQFGLSLTFAGDSWGVGSFLGEWAMAPGEHAQWTVSDQEAAWVKACRKLLETLDDAGKRNVGELVGTPVEVKFEGMALSSWRVLTEVLSTRPGK